MSPSRRRGDRQNALTLLPPYGTDEIAAAVLARLATRDVRVAQLSVAASDVPKLWRIAARLQDGREIVEEYPYAAPEGIHTPGELADWFVRAALGP